MASNCVRLCSAALLLSLLSLPASAERNLPRPPGTTRYALMLSQLQALLALDKAQGAGRMELTNIGLSVQGRGIWMVTLHGVSTENRLSTASTQAEGGDQNASPKRVFYLCRQHGHEPASTEAALQFASQLVKAPAGSPLAQELEHVTVYVVPMANPDGSEAFLRHNAHGKDINRDWLARTQPETRALYGAVMRVHPDVITDQHELYPNDTRLDFTETVGVGSGAADALVQACGETQAVVQMAMKAAGVATAVHVVTDRHPARLAHRFGGVVAGVPTLLFETSRLAKRGRSVASRAQSHLQFMLTVLRDTAGERDALLAEAAAAPYGQGRAAALLASRHKAYQRNPAANIPPAEKTPTPPALPSLSDGPAKDSE